MIGIPLGLLYANAMEWVIHKHVLHDKGRKRGTFWGFHLHDHHKASVLQDFYDSDYDKPFWSTQARWREAWTLTGVAVAHLPLAPVAPLFTATVVYSAARYYRIHKKAHLDPAWAREHLPWHVDHHLGRDHDQNWCVTHPFFDDLMRTRVPYVGTEEEREDRARRDSRAAATA